MHEAGRATKIGNYQEILGTHQKVVSAELYQWERL